MTSVTLSQFRNRQSDDIAAAQRDPVEITSRGAGRRVAYSISYVPSATTIITSATWRSSAASRADTGRG